MRGLTLFVIIAFVALAIAQPQFGKFMKELRDDIKELRQEFRANRGFNYDPEFLNFAKKFLKNHENATAERLARRQANFKKHADFFKNFRNQYFQVGENEFSDLSDEELIQSTCRTELPAESRSLPSAPLFKPLNSVLPASLDYRTRCQPVKSQGQCGSCWAFSTATMLECYNKIRVSTWNQVISPQYLVDCSKADFGCNGGWPRKTLEFIKFNSTTSVPTDPSYPYVSGPTKVPGTCKTTTPRIPMNYNNIYQYRNVNVTYAKQILNAHGPVVVAMYAPAIPSFSQYKSGIFFDSNFSTNSSIANCAQVNHGVVLMGWGKDPISNQEFWIVRNSWGTTWGEAGDFRIRADATNNCNILCHLMTVD